MPESFLECIICGNKDNPEDGWAAKILGLQYPYAVKRCIECDIRWLSPRPTAEEYQKIYQDDSYFSGDQVPETYELVVQARIEWYKKRCRKLQNFMEKDSFKLLDIGAATGEFVHVAKSYHIHAEGIELSEWACQRAKEKYNIDLKCADLFSAGYPDSSFDVIHMHHVFEHILQPVSFLHKAKKILKRSGILVLEVPYQFDNGLEMVRKTLGRTKRPEFSLFSIHHPYFYSPKAFSAVLKKCGFDTLNRITFDKTNPMAGTKSEIFLGGLVKTGILALSGFFNRGDFIDVIARSN